MALLASAVNDAVRPGKSSPMMSAILQLDSVVARLSEAASRLTIANNSMIGAEPPSTHKGIESLGEGAVYEVLNRVAYLQELITSIEDQVTRVESL